MDEPALLQGYLTIGAMLFGIGLVGFISRRNMIVMFLAVEMMLQGVGLSLVAWGRYHGDWGGQMLTIFILAVAACEAAVVMALVMMLFHRKDNLDIAAWQTLREANQPEFIDAPEGPICDEKPVWPHLAPAGIEPVRDPEQEAFRPLV
jgi:NADH-quinone oxidoreductase subunit K